MLPCLLLHNLKEGNVDNLLCQTWLAAVCADLQLFCTVGTEAVSVCTDNHWLPLLAEDLCADITDGLGLKVCSLSLAGEKIISS